MEIEHKPFRNKTRISKCSVVYYQVEVNSVDSTFCKKSLILPSVTDKVYHITLSKAYIEKDASQTKKKPC
jgi:hypothetical protein